MKMIKKISFVTLASLLCLSILINISIAKATVKVIVDGLKRNSLNGC